MSDGWLDHTPGVNQDGSVSTRTMRETLATQSAVERMSGNSTPQMPYGFVARSNWGEGNAQAAYAVGDVVYVPEGCSAVISGRCARGLHRVEACFSIGEDASFYYRLSASTIVGEKGRIRVVTDWDSCSDRLHVFPGGPDYTAGWLRLYSAVAGGEQP